MKQKNLFLVKIFCLNFLLFLLSANKILATSPNHEWTIVVPSAESTTTGVGASNGVFADDQGNTYVVGSFSGEADFGVGQDSATRTSNGNADIFISKYSSDGTRVWTKTYGGSGSDWANSVVVDDASSVYVIGFFSETVDFGAGNDLAERSAAGSTDVFILKLDTNGNRYWTKTIGGGGSENGYSLALDASATYIYAVGEFYGTADFGTGGDTAQRTADGSADAFISKYATSNGDRAWTKTIGGTSDEFSRTISIGSNDLIYVGGYFTGEANFGLGGDLASRTSQGAGDGFVSRYQPDGVRDWTITFGGLGEDKVRSLVVNSDQTIFVGGSFEEEVDFGEGEDASSRTSAGLVDAFLSKYSPAGERVWTQTFGGLSYEEVSSVAIGSNGNLFITGWFGDEVDFDPTSGETIRSSNSGWDSSMFLSSFSPTGAYLWTRVSEGGDWSSGYSVSTGYGSIYVAGDVIGAVNFNPAGDSFVVSGDEDNGSPALTRFSLASLVEGEESGGEGSEEGGSGEGEGEESNVEENSQDVDNDTIAQFSSNNTGNSSGFSATTKADPPSCTAQKPVGSPYLFEAIVKGQQLTLYFTPVNDNAKSYIIAYSSQQNQYEHAVEFTPAYNNGVINYTINHLDLNQTYYVSVRAGNDCASGEWSNQIKIVTPKNLLQKFQYYMNVL